VKRYGEIKKDLDHITQSNFSRKLLQKIPRGMLTNHEYEHFSPPLLLNVNAIYSKIRNLKYRYLTESILFPTEITQYEPYVIREVLHNCIAHQDYGLNSRINVIEKPEELIFTNLRNFIPKTIETEIEQDAPQEYYRNQFLANTMVNLNMIDTIGSGY